MRNKRHMLKLKHKPKEKEKAGKDAYMLTRARVLPMITAVHELMNISSNNLQANNLKY